MESWIGKRLILILDIISRGKAVMGLIKEDFSARSNLDGQKK